MVMMKSNRLVFSTTPIIETCINSYYFPDKRYKIKCTQSQKPFFGLIRDPRISKLPSCYIVSYEEVNYYPDTHVRTILISITTYSETKDNGIFVKSLDSYSLRHGTDGTPVLISKGKIVCDLKTIIRVFESISKESLKLFAESTRCSYYENLNYPIYCVLRNPQLFKMFKDISKLTVLYKDFSVTSLRNRRNINRYLRKGDTDNALRWYLSGYHFPNKVSKYLLENEVYNPDQYRFIDEFLKYRDEEDLIDFLKVNNIASIKTITFLVRYGFNGPLKGFSLGSFSQPGFTAISFPIERLIEAGHGDKIPKIKNNSLKAFFKEIDWIYKYYGGHPGFSSISSSIFTMVNTSQDRLNYFNSGIKIRKPFNPYELNRLSEITSLDLNYLVFPFFYRQLDIYLIEKNRKYLGYIKMVDNLIVEARTVENKDLSSDPSLQSVVLDWIATFNLSIYTDEITGGSYSKEEFDYLPVSSESTRLYGILFEQLESGPF